MCRQSIHRSAQRSNSLQKRMTRIPLHSPTTVTLLEERRTGMEVATQVSCSPRASRLHPLRPLRRNKMARQDVAERHTRNICKRPVSILGYRLDMKCPTPADLSESCGLTRSHPGNGHGCARSRRLQCRNGGKRAGITSDGLCPLSRPSTFKSRGLKQLLRAMRPQTQMQRRKRRRRRMTPVTSRICREFKSIQIISIMSYSR